MKKFFVFLFISVLVSIYSSDDGFSYYDFFGIRMNYTYFDVTSVIHNGKTYKDEIYKDIITIVPSGDTPDMAVSLYNNSILKFTKFQVDEKFLNDFVKQFGKWNEMEQNSEEIFYRWNIDDYQVEMQLYKKNDIEINKNVFYIINQKVYNECYKTNISAASNKNYSYEVRVNNLRLRETPSLDGKIIRLLKEGEIIVLIEKNGKEELIQGDKGFWVKVKTKQNETGWCFDAYLSKK
jgi:hypothetical protein